MINRQLDRRRAGGKKEEMEGRERWMQVRAEAALRSDFIRQWGAHVKEQKKKQALFACRSDKNVEHTSCFLKLLFYSDMLQMTPANNKTQNPLLHGSIFICSHKYLAMESFFLNPPPHPPTEWNCLLYFRQQLLFGINRGRAECFLRDEAEKEKLSSYEISSEWRSQRKKASALTPSQFNCPVISV